MGGAESKERFLRLWRALFALGCASFIFSFAVPLLSLMNKGACLAIYVALVAGAAWLSTKLTNSEAKGLGLALIIFALDAAFLGFGILFSPDDPTRFPVVEPIIQKVMNAFGIMFFVSFGWVLAGPMLNLKYALVTFLLALVHLVAYFFLLISIACGVIGACL